MKFQIKFYTHLVDILSFICKWKKWLKPIMNNYDIYRFDIGNYLWYPIHHETISSHDYP